MCFSVVKFYCFQIPGGQRRSCIKHEVVVTSPCVRCITTLADIRNLQSGRGRTLKTMANIRIEYRMSVEEASQEERRVRFDKKERLEEAEHSPIANWLHHIVGNLLLIRRTHQI